MKLFFLNKILFDAADYELVRAVNEAVSGRNRYAVTAQELHPRGIRELAEPQTIRLARCMLQVLDVLETGEAAMERRIQGLQALRDELLEGLDVPLRYNTARVVLQVIKELVRGRRDPLRQLRLAHDLRTAILGNPLFIRKLLKRYHLVEMPEEWAPVSFDYHIHDANTKGRKSPSHLMMDAWIKGIVRVQVIYYNEVPREAAEELLRAAAILNVTARIGVEFRVLFRGRFLEMIWSPRGFSGVEDYLKFLDRDRMRDFSRKCRKAAHFRRKMVLAVLAQFNREGRKQLNQDYGIALNEVAPEAFLASVRYGQPSLEHVGEYLLRAVRQALLPELEALEAKRDCSASEKLRKQELRARLGVLSGELLIGRYLDRSILERPPQDLDDLPELNRYSPEQLIDELHKVIPGFRMTLNLTRIRLEDVIEILYDCRGEITTLEIYNLKDEAVGRRPDDAAVNQLRHALNSGAVIQLKHLLRRATERITSGDASDREARLEKFRRILRDMPKFLSFYARSPLQVSIGSDSASRPSAMVHGMGLVVVDSLTAPVRRAIRRGQLPELSLLPVHSEVYRQISFPPPGVRRWFQRNRRSQVDWICLDLAQKIDVGTGNLATLGGFFAPPPEEPLRYPVCCVGEIWCYLNSNLRIIAKIMIGFLAAFLTFRYASHNWWFLMWFGAPIWLGITAVRNVIQSVAAGGGFSRAALHKWSDFVSWQRVADSLMYTGLSVPLLDYLVKSVILHRWLGWDAQSQPILVFTGIALANGLYITGHNLLRAFPRSAVWGNWLRAPLSIPLALLFNGILGGVLQLIGFAGAEQMLQQWAAILSKLASDTIGGVIESRADRDKYVAARYADLRTKLRELFALISRLELLLPDEDLPKLLREKRSFLHLAGLKRSKLVHYFYINALDMMYIWMRQPRSITAMRRLMAGYTTEERIQFLRTQEILCREKSISKLFLAGLVGANFRRALAFYLHDYRRYLAEIQEFDPSPQQTQWHGLAAIVRPYHEPEEETPEH